MLVILSPNGAVAGSLVHLDVAHSARLCVFGHRILSEQSIIAINMCVGLRPVSHHAIRHWGEEFSRMSCLIALREAHPQCIHDPLALTDLHSILQVTVRRPVKHTDLARRLVGAGAQAL